ncbi:zinc finger CCCH domain-containing protein 3 [Oratosquilla oratoria]|uniref:zinc finger CCCH domain-containing protein 3 n=1 Tax=Oratosquilla oratoria TaxID=337810 RepID=UPI003F764AC4
MHPSQKSIHINPGFLNAQNTARKVHINPAFFKTQVAQRGTAPCTVAQVQPQQVGFSSQVVPQAPFRKVNPSVAASRARATEVCLAPKGTRTLHTQKPSVVPHSVTSYAPPGYVNPRHVKYVSAAQRSDVIHNTKSNAKSVVTTTQNQVRVPNSALHLNLKYKIDRTEPNSVGLHRTQHRIKETEVLSTNKLVNRYKVSNSVSSGQNTSSVGTLEKNFHLIAGALQKEKSHRLAAAASGENNKVKTRYKIELDIGKKKEVDRTKGCESFDNQFKVFSRSKIVRKKHLLKGISGSRNIHKIQDDAGQANKTTAGSVSHRSFHVPKKRLSFLTKTKLVRRRSASNSCSGSDGKKYCIKTKTKIVKKGEERLQDGIASTKSNPTKLSDKSRYSVISKTKLVRRRSSSSTSKALSKYHLRLVHHASCLKHWKSTKYPPNAHSAFKVSPVVKAAKSIKSKYRIVNHHSRDKSGVISKYKLNRIDPSRIAKLKQPVLSKRFKTCKHDGRHKRSRYTWNKNGRKPSRGHCRVYSVSSNLKTAKRIVSIGGIMYKSTKTRLQRHTRKAVGATHLENQDIKYFVKLHGNQFIMSRNGRTLKRLQPKSLMEKSQSRCGTATLPRLHIGGRTYTQTQSGQYELTHAHQTRAALNIARQKSLAVLRRNTMSLRKKEYCLFYNRFGRCTKKDKGECAFIHDPDKVAVCTRFVRGRCKVEGCYFSHKIDPDKMPVCSHFIRSSCIRENCPYSHVRVNPNAPVCKDFLKGHCPTGKECKKQHILDCEEYRISGKCSREKFCPLRHRRIKPRTTSRSERTSNRSKEYKRTYKNIQESSAEDTLRNKGDKAFKKQKVTLSENEAKRRYFEVGSELYESLGNDEFLGEPDLDMVPVMKVCPDKQSISDVTVHELKHQSQKPNVPIDASQCKTEGLANENRNQRKENGICVSDKLCFIRKPPLPRQMPSYIPLSMD